MSGKSDCILASAIMCSPVGNYFVEACESGIHSVSLEKGVNNDNFETMGDPQVRILKGNTKHSVLVKFVGWLCEYFHKTLDWDWDDAICRKVADPDGGTFREQVWLTLKENVKFGETVTYGELATLAGKPRAARAVGSAMSNNPVSLLMPCHRVIPACGGTGNYAKATMNDVKVWLLKHEGSL